VLLSFFIILYSRLFKHIKDAIDKSNTINDNIKIGFNRQSEDDIRIPMPQQKFSSTAKKK